MKRLRQRLRGRLRTPAPGAVLVILTGLALGAWLVADYTRLRSETRLLERRLRSLEARGVSREEVQTQLARDLSRTRAAIRNLVSERSLGRTLLEEHAGDVCLLHVAYEYVDARDGSSMRVQRPGAAAPVALVHDVFGTGFPVAEGVLLSNRHVLEPWWQNPEAETKEREGFVPRRLQLRALCPGLAAPIPLELEATSAEHDLATARFEAPDLDPLPLAPPERRLGSGASVLQLGYPTGLQAALARAPERDRRALVPLLTEDPAALADTLLARGVLQPLLTFGRVSEVRPDRLTFDAPTARGASGGPLFNVRGEVVGVTSEILPGFAGASFAVPLRSDTPLVEASRSH